EQARRDVKREVVPPARRVKRDPLLQTRDEKREQPPHVPVRKAEADRLSPGVGGLAQALPGEEHLCGERQAERRPKGQPPHPLRGATERCVLTRHVTILRSDAQPVDFWLS